MAAPRSRGRDGALDVDPRQPERASRRAFLAVRGRPEEEEEEDDDRPTDVVSVTAAPNLHALVVPEGWTLENIVRLPDQALLSTPPTGVRYMATIDFRKRGFRGGHDTMGRFVDEAWDSSRKKYGGRGWQQQIVDDAVAYLRKVLK